MNKEVTEALEFLKWLLEGLIRFYPDHPLFSRIEAERIAKGEDRWIGEDPRGLLGLAKRSLGLPESASLAEVITRLQNLVDNPSAVSNLPDPVLAKLRDEDEELKTGDSAQEKRSKLETIAKRPSRVRYVPKAPVEAAPAPKVPTPPTAKAPEVVGFVDIKAPADIATLQGATEKAFVDEVVQTIRRERPEIGEVATLEELRDTATEIVHQMEREGTGGASYKINTTAFSRAITDRARLAEVLVPVTVAAEAPPTPPQRKVVHLAPESPAPLPPLEVQEKVSELVGQVRKDRETFVREFSQKIEQANPKFTSRQAQEAAERIAIRIEGYQPGKVAEDAAFASIALNPELFERTFPEPEVRAKILNEAIKVTSERQAEEEIARQVLPTYIPDAKEPVVDTLYQAARQRFVPTPEETPGPVYFEPETVIEKVEKAPQVGLDLSSLIRPTGAVPTPPTLAPAKTLEFLSPSAASSEDAYKTKLSDYIRTQVALQPADLSDTQIQKGAQRAAELIIDNTPPEIKAAPSPTPISLDIDKLIQSFRETPEVRDEAIIKSFEISKAPPPKAAVIRVAFTPSPRSPEDAKRELADRIAQEINSLPQEAKIDPLTGRSLTPAEIEGASAALAAQTVAQTAQAVGATPEPMVLKIQTPVILGAAAKPEVDLQSQVSASFEIIKTPAPVFPAAPTLPTPRPAVSVSVSPAGKTADQIKDEVSTQIQEQLANIPPEAGVVLTEEQRKVVAPIITEEALKKIEPGASEPLVVKVDAQSLAGVVSKPAEEIAEKVLEIISVAPAAAAAAYPKPPQEQVFVAVSEKFGPDIKPEVKTQLENLTNSVAKNPEKFQAQLKEKLLDSPEFTSRFTSPEEIATAAETCSRDITERLVSIDKGVAGPPTLIDIAASPEVLDKTLATPIEKQAFVPAASEKGAQIGQVAPAVASALGVDEEVIKGAFQPRPLSVSDSPKEGASTLASKNLLPAAEGKIPVLEAIIPPAVAIPAEGKLPWAKAEGPAQELGIKVTYIATPETLPSQVSDLITSVQKEGFAFNQKDPQNALPLFVFASGVSSTQFQGLINQAQDKGFSKETVGHLQEFLVRIKALEEARPELFAELQKIYPAESLELTFVEYSEAPGVFTFTPSGGGYSLGIPSFAGPLPLNPGGLVSKGLDKLFAPARQKIEQTLGKTAVGKLTKAGIGKAISALATKIGAAIGSAIGGPVGTAIGAFIGKVLGAVLNWVASKLQKHWKEALAVGAGVAGVLMGSPILAALGVGALLLLGTGIGAFLLTTLAGILGALVSAIVVPLVVALLSIPIIVAIILFVINSGAYLVPPSLSLFAESPYIRVEKTAQVISFNSAGSCEDPGPNPGTGELDSSVNCENEALAISVEYTITVTATRGTLTNISFTHERRVIRESGTVTSSAPTETPPVLISPVTPYVYTYTDTYGGAEYTDSLVQNTFRVTADTDEVIGTSSSGSASVIIGEPPTGCFTFDGDDRYLAQFQTAAAELSAHASYAAKLCEDGEITVRLDTGGPVTTGACAGISGTSLIYFDNCSYFESHGQQFITYILAHESGHIYYWRVGDFDQYQSRRVASEGYLPTYCLNQSAFEDFAEIVGDFVDNGRLRRLCARDDERPFRMCESRFGAHCAFARDVIFNE